MVLCTPPLGHRNENQRWSGQTMKPRKHENMKPIVISMSQRWSGRKPETTKPIGFLLSRDWVDKTMKPWNQETNDLEIECAKSWNHETYRHLDDPEIELSKPWNHETTKPQNHEIYRHLMSQWWSVRNHETMKPQNLLAFQCPRDGVDETMKPIVISMTQRWSGRNYETMKPIVI